MTNLEYEVCIPVKNEENLIPWTLDSINNQNTPPSSIYICLNGTTDNTREVIQKYGDSKVKIVESKPGKANAWNTLFHETSKLERLLFCDGDVSLSKCAAEKIFEKLEEDEHLAIVGGSIKNNFFNDSSIFVKYFGEKTRDPIIYGLSGALYGTHKSRLIKLAQQKNMKLIPAHIINDDLYLHMISSGHIEILESPFAQIYAPDNFSDWVGQTRRTLLGSHQAKTEFPNKFKQTIKDRNKLVTPKLERLKNQSLANQFGVMSLFFLRKILSLESRFRTPKPTWEGIKSTKGK